MCRVHQTKHNVSRRKVHWSVVSDEERPLFEETFPSCDFQGKAWVCHPEAIGGNPRKRGRPRMYTEEIRTKLAICVASFNVSANKSGALLQWLELVDQAASIHTTQESKALGLS